VTGAAEDPEPFPVDVHRAAVPREARDFQGDRAGIVTRLVANLIDGGVIIGVVVGGYLGWAGLLFLLNPTGFTWPPFTFARGVIYGGVVAVVYFTASWSTTGRTVGDRIMGLRVVNFRGNRVRYVGAFLRAGFCTMFPIGLLWVVISPTNRSVQDTVLRTSVIYDWVWRA